MFFNYNYEKCVFCEKTGTDVNMTICGMDVLYSYHKKCVNDVINNPHEYSLYQLEKAMELIDIYKKNQIRKKQIIKTMENIKKSNIQYK